MNIKSSILFLSILLLVNVVSALGSSDCDVGDCNSMNSEGIYCNANIQVQGMELGSVAIKPDVGEDYVTLIERIRYLGNFREGNSKTFEDANITLKKISNDYQNIKNSNITLQINSEICQIGIDETKQCEGYKVYYGYSLNAGTDRDEVSIYIIRPDPDEIKIYLRETKNFMGMDFTLAKIDKSNPPKGCEAVAWFVHDTLECIDYCFPVCGDDICGFGEDVRNDLKYCPEDCMQEYCSDGICDDFDRKNCRQDCSDEFCDDGVCESFELNSCPDDCGQDLFEQYKLGKGYIIQNKDYILDKEYSIRYVNSNFDYHTNQKNEDLIATFKLLQNGKTIKEFDLNGLEFKRPMENVPYLFKYVWNEPKERALIEVYGILEFSDSDETIELTENKGFFCDENFYYLTKHEITDIDRNTEYDEIVLNILYGNNKGYNLHLTNEDINDINSNFEGGSSSRDNAFYCNGDLPYINEFDTEEGYIILSFYNQEDECQEDSECDDNDESTKDLCSGNQKRCEHIKIVECLSDDGYCSDSCSYEKDTDCDEPYQCNSNSDCDDNNVCTDDSCEGETKKCVNKLIKEGCNFNGVCINLGTRKSGEYCSEGKSLKKQKEKGEECTNSYECISNVCEEGLCFKTNAIQKLINWIIALFK